MSGDWKIFRGTRQPHNGISKLPAPPNWRNFGDRSGLGDLLSCTFDIGDDPQFRRHLGLKAGATVLTPDADEVRMVNAALYLRRPLLITGHPGTGKSSLAYAVAEELGLGPVLCWPITTRTTLREGLYQYDAIGRLHQAQVRELRQDQRKTVEDQWDGIGNFLRLGPLGTAFLPWQRPRVLLIDELDKCDPDLPNDLLHLFEEGGFVIPELSRLPNSEPVSVWMADGNAKAPITHGRVQCADFPVVIVTSNGERDFPPAFLRRCIRLTLQSPDEDKLQRMIDAHLQGESDSHQASLISDFMSRLKNDELVAADQLLNTLYLVRSGNGMTDDDVASLRDSLMRSLDQ